MKQKLLLYIILSISFMAQGFSQQLEVTSRYEGRDVVFDATFNGSGSYTLVLSFSELQGYKSLSGRKAIINIAPPFSGNSIYKLTEIEGARASTYRYSYQYFQGKYNAKPDLDFPYLLPVKPGENVRTFWLENIEATLGKSVTDKILGVTFSYTGVDTVYAIRSGQVVRVENSTRDRIKPEAGTVYYDEPSRSHIEVEHKDGTIARYVCMTSGKSLLEEGDRIIAGQPLAVFTQKDDNQEMKVGIHLFRLGKKFEYEVIMPKYYTDNGLIQPEYGKEYVGASAKEIVEKELTKKEKKNLNL